MSVKAILATCLALGLSACISEAGKSETPQWPTHDPALGDQTCANKTPASQLKADGPCVPSR